MSSHFLNENTDLIKVKKNLTISETLLIMKPELKGKLRSGTTWFINILQPRIFIHLIVYRGPGIV